MKGRSLTQLDLIFIKINHQLLVTAVGQALPAPSIRRLLTDIEEEGGVGGGGEDGLQPLPHHLLLPTAEVGSPILPGGTGIAQKFSPTLQHATGNHNWILLRKSFSPVNRLPEVLICTPMATRPAASKIVYFRAESALLTYLRLK